nr:1623_t:CDS:2 [Entrophospora candida]
MDYVIRAHLIISKVLADALAPAATTPQQPQPDTDVVEKRVHREDKDHDKHNDDYHNDNNDDCKKDDADYHKHKEHIDHDGVDDDKDKYKEDIEHHDTIKEECENLPSIDKTTFIEQPIVVVLDKTETRECEGELQEDCKEISDGIGDGVYNDVQQHIDEFTYPTTLPSAY